ncbi:MAG: hypothetical protein ABI137_02090 [Antricoccus sp.]
MGAPPIGFDVVMRGFDRNQVQDAVGRLEDDLRTVVTERDQAITRANDLHIQLEQASSDVSTLNSKLRNAQAPTFESMGERIASMLRLAEEEAGEIRRQANTDAEQTRAEAAAAKNAVDQDNTQTRADAQQTLDEAKAEADRILGEAKAEAAQHTEDRHREAAEHLQNAKTEAAELTEKSVAARSEADQDFHITLVQRRKQAQTEHEERDRSSKDEATTRVQDATHSAATLLSSTKAQCASLIADARAEVEYIKTVRANVAQTLLEARTVLGGIPENLADLPDPEPSRELAEQRAAAQIESGAQLADDATEGAMDQPATDAGVDTELDSTDDSAADAPHISDATPNHDDADLNDVDQHIVEGNIVEDEILEGAGEGASVNLAGTSVTTGQDSVFDVEAVDNPEPHSSVHPANAVIADEDEIPASERTIQIGRLRNPNSRIIDRKSGN